MKNLIKAINNVMTDCENVEKNLNVGTGNASYKGVSDKDVKLMINRSMRKNGLAIFPIKIEPKLTVERWVEKNNYGEKQKQQVFTEVLTTYKLIHESGESIEIQGYGHGVDSQDKSAGKATTYALKYALLYQFLVATGEIDDADKTHSDEQPKPQQLKKEPMRGNTSKPWITPKQFEQAKERASIEVLEKVFETYQFRNIEQKEELEEIYAKLKNQ